MTNLHFTPASPTRSEFDCQAGELALCAGALRRTDGLYTPVSHPRIIAAEEPSAIEAPDLSPLPVEFGMVRAGALSCIEGVSSRSGEGAQTTHPATSVLTATTTETVEALYTDAVARQATARGLFCRPFLIRHALRMPDGRHICISAPVLMVPWVLPPCIAVSAQTDGDSALYTVSLQHVACFSLSMRLRAAIPPALADLADALDIFATDEIPTYDGTIRPDRITTYARVAEGAQRSRHTPDGDVFAGRFDPGTGVHADHTVASLDLSAVRCLDLQPNPRLWTDITRASTFRRIASIPLSVLQPGRSFVPVEVERADITLPDPALCGAMHRGACSYVYADRLFRGGGSLLLPPPALPGCTAQYVGDAEGAETAARVEVRTRSHGAEAMVAAEGWCAPALTDSPPRYVYYPDPGATTLDMHCAGRCLRYHLKPHPAMHGAYATDCEVRSSDFATSPGSPLVSQGCEVPAPGLITASVPSNRLVRDDNLTLSLASPVSALCAALEAPARSEYGRFPLYAFTDEGIYSIDISPASTAGSQGARAVLLRHLDGRPLLAPVAWRQSVVFADASGALMSLSSSKLERCVYPDAEQLPVPRLPRLEQVLREAGCPYSAEGLTLPHIGTLDSIRPTNAGLLLTSGTDRWLLDPDTGDCAVLPPVATDSDGGALETQGQEGSVSQDTDSDEAETRYHGWMLLLTRSLRIDSPVQRIALQGLGVEQAAMAVYGSLDLQQWQLVRTARGMRLSPGSLHPWRALRVLCIARAGALYGLRMEGE